MTNIRSEMKPPNKPFQRIAAKIAAPAEWRRYINAMNRKKLILISIALLTVVISIILLAIGKPVYPVIIIGALAAFIIYGVYAPPEKHKSFGYADQQRAMRAFDRTDLLNFESESGSVKKTKQKKKKT
jgi:hypothetical protein